MIAGITNRKSLHPITDQPNLRITYPENYVSEPIQNEIN